MQTSKPWHIEIEYILSYLLPNRWICIIETNCILMSKTLSGVVLYYVILDVPTIEYYVFFYISVENVLQGNNLNA